MITKTNAARGESRGAQKIDANPSSLPIVAATHAVGNPAQCKRTRMPCGLGIVEANNIVAPCPVCGKPSGYACRLDRYTHFDGSANLDCWIAILRGEVQ